jgi:hypothetical protein
MAIAVLFPSTLTLGAPLIALLAFALVPISSFAHPRHQTAEARPPRANRSPRRDAYS